ncbi:SLAM family member 8-like [Grus japonensis]|uniref:SLAM family member 8-like n=1 Tax=Grus japonensis TaxID=30415 RepID=A0ABC9XTS4_GRUJA
MGGKGAPPGPLPLSPGTAEPGSGGRRDGTGFTECWPPPPPEERCYLQSAKQCSCRPGPGRERCVRLPQAQAQPRQVNGVLGGSVLLSPALPPNKTVKEIEWSFSSGTGTTTQVAEFGPDGFERPDPKDRFKDRLEMVNETALRIGVLERGDSGVYGARLKLHPALVEDQSFRLSVYELLPHPKIQSWLLWKSPAGPEAPSPG